MEDIVVWIVKIAKFIIILGILIFVHELGHFLVARRVGVYIKKFFLGFDIGGLKLFRFKGKETEYGIGILPLGGYVRMAGQEDLPPGDEEAREKLEEEEKDIPPERRFDRKPLHQRAAIVIAGPLMNLILGLLVFIVVAMIGVQVPRDTSGSLIGSVEKGLPAEKAGLRSGDRIVEIDGEQIEGWNALNWKIRFTEPGEELGITLLRDGKRISAQVRPEKFRGANYPRIGIASGGKVVVWEIRADAPAARAGLQVGDIITTVNGRPVISTSIKEMIGDQTGDVVAASVYRPGTDETLQLDLPIYSKIIPGLALDGNRVWGVNYQAGDEVQLLRKGDQVMAIDGEEITPEEVAAKIGAVPDGAIIKLDVQRAGWMFFKPSTRFTIRAAVSTVPAIEGTILGQLRDTDLVRYSGMKAITVGAGMAVESVEKMVSIFYWMIVGRIDASEVSGPVGIFNITSQVHGLSNLLSLLALISINLGIINLLPLPVLDGGHLLFFLIEAIIRRPLSTRFMLVAQHVGLVAIAALFLLVTYNDILRVLGY